MASRVYSDATTPNVFFGLGTYQIPQRRPEAQKDSACRQGLGKLATRKQLEAEGKAPDRRTPLLAGLAEFPVAFRSPDTRDRGSISRIRDLDSELQRPSSPSPSSYTTSSHPPRGCFRKIWTTGCSRCMQQHISLSTSTRIAWNVQKPVASEQGTAGGANNPRHQNQKEDKPKSNEPKRHI